MIEIRPAGDDDIDAVVELEAALFAEDSGVHDPFADVTWPVREGRADAARLVSDDDGVVLVATDGGEVVGLLMGYATTSSSTRRPIRSAVLRTMFVTPSHRRLGVGELLVGRFVEWARSAGCVEARVNHFAANRPAGALYEAQGFRPHSIDRVRPLA